MKKIISKKNCKFIKSVIGRLSEELGFKDPKEILWLVYGSYVINANTPSSDLDIIGIHSSFKNKRRIVLEHNKVLVHLSLITMKEIKDDGEKRLYGIYYTGKIINPHIFFYGKKDQKSEAIRNAGNFIAPLAGFLGTLTGSELFTPSQITALVFCAFLSIGPSFDLVILSYFVSPRLKDIWEELCKNTVLMLKACKGIKRKGKGYVFTKKFPSYKKFHFERMIIAARHWSYVAITHNDYKFQDWLFKKAEKKAKKIDPTGKNYRKLILFLQKESGLSTIYI